jgi:starvation-inducible DNA-binding protein
MNEQLINILKTLLGTHVDAKFRAHGYHWNVEGDDFPQYHELFEKIYEALDAGIDPLAEWIRIFQGYAPFKLSRFMELSVIPETEVSADPMNMAQDLYNILEMVIAAYKSAGTEANAAQEYALANFFADQQGIAQKFCWQLRASLKEEMED